MNNDTFSELSVDEIQQRLSSIDSDRAVLEKELDRKRQQVKKDMAQEIRDMIEDRGYDVGEILELVSPRKRSGSGSGRGKGNRSYVSYVDPDNENNVYMRGVLPKWMKEQMAAKGLDSSNKEDRDSFKQQYLSRVEG